MIERVALITGQVEDSAPPRRRDLYSGEGGHCRIDMAIGRRIRPAGHSLETVPLPYATGKPEDIGEAVAYLASPRASFVNGHVLAVDGGWSTAHYLNQAALTR